MQKKDLQKELCECPFCGGTHSINVINFFTGDSFRKCDICGAEAPETKTPEEAAEKWNTRPAEDALKYNLAQKKAALLVIAQWCDMGLRNGMRKHDMNEVFLWIRKMAKEEMVRDYDTDR